MTNESMSYLSLLTDSNILDLINYCIESENSKTDMEVYKKSPVAKISVTRDIDNEGYFLKVLASYREFIIRDYCMTAKNLISPYISYDFAKELHLFMTRHFGGQIY